MIFYGACRLLGTRQDRNPNEQHLMLQEMIEYFYLMTSSSGVISEIQIINLVVTF